MEVNSIYQGDNLEIMSKFPNESVDLIYADPPFFSNKHYEVIWDDGAEIRAFQDRWKGGIEHYISWMEPRLRECHRVLKKTGSMYLHCDWHANAHLRILMDNIFGEKHFLNEIVWCYETAGKGKNFFARKHETLLFYSKGTGYTFNSKAVAIPRKREKHMRIGIDKDGREYEEKTDKKSGKIYRWYFDEGRLPLDYWTDIQFINRNARERLGYPTQKPLALLERVIKASSNDDSIVLDPFCGCGTAIIAAQKLGKKWIGIDVSPTACKLMKKRMQKECGVDAHLIKGEVDIKYIQNLAPFEFQNWVVVDKFMGRVSDKKSGDMGIDGYTPQVLGGFPIQVKQSEDIGRNVIDNFETAMSRTGKKKGYIVAYSFGKGAYEEVARVKNSGELEIILRTIKELLEGKVE